MKKQIEFDFAKWGQEGISVEKNYNEVVSMMKAADGVTLCCEIKINNGTSTQLAFVSRCNLTMLEEVKPREFYVNVYENFSCNIYKHQEEAEVGLSRSKINTPSVKGETIKVREILE